MNLSRREFIGGLMCAAAAMPTPASAAPRWSDVHLHLIGGREKQFDQAAERALAHMDRHGIAKAVVFPPPMPNAGIFDYTDYVPALRKHPRRFGFLAGGGTLNPLIQHTPPASVTPEARQKFIDAAKRMLDEGAVGFGELTALHLSLVPNHPFEESSIEHPFFYALTEVAGPAKAMIDLHMDAVPADVPLPKALDNGRNPPSLKGNIAGLERLLAHERNARIAWAHGGSDLTGNMTPALIGRLMAKHPNLYMSLRPVPPQASRRNPFKLRFFNLIVTENGTDPEWLALLQRHSDRFVMGADAFLLAESIHPQSPLIALGRGNDPRTMAARMVLDRLPPQLARKIGVTNANNLYRLG